MMCTERRARVVWFALGVVSLASCYQKHEPEAGGESHFLELCTSSCEGGLECIGNVCTRRCAQDAECSAIASGASCLEESASDGPRACGLACERDAECAAVGVGLACNEGACGPAGAGLDAGVAFAPAPLVLLVVDTSGSMERVPDCACETAGCEECLPDCTQAERNRWAEMLEALTGTFEDFACEAIARREGAGARYDSGYLLDYHRPTGSAQREDGILDEYGERVRFGMATFDSWDTYVGSPPLVPAGEFDQARSHTWEGLWSYGAVDGNAGLLRYPNEPISYRIDTGVRSPIASEGPLTVALEPTGFGATNAEIQERLQAVRPYGGTPIAAALDDVRYYFASDASARRVPVQLRHVVLMTDGYPDDDYRQYGCDCTQNIDPTGDDYCGGLADCTDPTTCMDHPDWMRCPYPTAEAAAAGLVAETPSGTAGGMSVDAPWQRLAPQVATFHVIGFALYDVPVRDRLDAIASAGGGTGARFAANGAELRTALAVVLEQILAGAEAPE